MKSYTDVLLIVFSLTLSINVPSAEGQIYECDGLWTNQPCAGVTPLFDEIVSTPNRATSIKREKEEILHRLIQARYQAKEKFSLSFDTRKEEKSCRNPETTADECQKLVDRALGKLESKIITNQRLHLQQAELEVRQAELLQNRENQRPIVIIQNVVTRTPFTLATNPASGQQKLPQQTARPNHKPHK